MRLSCTICKKKEEVRFRICDDCAKIMKECECGCGEYTQKYGNYGGVRRFVNQSHAMVKHYIDNPEAGDKHSHDLLSYYSNKDGPNKGKTFGEVTRLKQSIAHINRYSDPQIRLEQSIRLKGIRRSEITRKNMKLSALYSWTEDRRREQRERYSNPKNHPNWNGGTSFLPYDERFNDEFKEMIRGRQNYECADSKLENCDYKNKALCVHHIDRDKQNTTSENCIGLCDKHHKKAHNEEARVRHREYNKRFIYV